MCSNFDNARPAPPATEVRDYAHQWLAGERGPLKTVHVWPRQDAWILRFDPEAGDWRFDAWRWSLVPFWSRERNPRMSTFNARAETVHRAPAFRGPWRHGRRCLIPLAAWYESARRVGMKGWVRIAPTAPGITFAGVWDAWTDRESDTPLHSFTMLTTAAAPSIARVHDRMPVIIAARDRDAWLDPATAPDVARRMLHPVEDDFAIRLPE